MFPRLKHATSMTFTASLLYLTTNYDFSNASPYNMYCFTAPPTRDRIRGEYENKIRRMSPPEKIFEVFAMHKKGNHIYMSHSDLFLAVCPYNYTTKPRDYSHDHEHEEEAFKSNALIEFADVDKDGLISLYEFYLFVDFMQTTYDDLVNIFGSDPKKQITKEEFRKFLDFIKGKKLDKLTIAKYLPDPRKERLSHDEFEQVEAQVTENLFKDAETIPLSKLIELRELLYRELYIFEFDSFEKDEKGNLTGEDFAKSLICYFDPAAVSKQWRLLNSIQWEGSVTLEEYINFQRFLREHLKTLQDTIEEKGVISKKKLKEIFSDYCKKENVKISDTQIDIFLQVMDANGNGRIDYDEFVGVVKQRAFYGAGEKTQNLEKPFVVLKNKLIKFGEKLVRIYEILQE